MFLGLLSGVLRGLLKEFIVILLSFITLSSFSILLKSSSPSIITLRLNHSTTISSSIFSSVFSCSPLSKKLYEKVTDISKYSNWSKRNDTKAKLKSDIMMLLLEDGFPPIPSESEPEDYEKVYKDILEQSENFRKYYNT